MQQRSQCCTSWRFCTGAARLETFFSTKVGLLLPSCLLAHAADLVPRHVLQVCWAKAGTTDTASSCSLITLFADPELPERKKLKLQQGQCLIRLLDKQVGLLQQLIATTNSHTSSPAHADRLPGCNMTTAQSVRGTKGNNTRHDTPCEHAHSACSLW